MKAALLVSLFILLSFSHAADPAPAKRQAFGPIQFGDTLAEAQAHLQLVVEGMNKRKQATPTAADVLRDFIVPGTKYPPKLAPRYAATVINIGTGSKYPVAVMEVHSEQVTDPAKVKADWETLRDIASSKFGIPAKTTPFATAQQDGSRFAETDLWKFNGLEIRLGIRTLSPPKSSAMLTATDPVRLVAP